MLSAAGRRVKRRHAPSARLGYDFPATGHPARHDARLRVRDDASHGPASLLFSDTRVSLVHSPADVSGRRTAQNPFPSPKTKPRLRQGSRLTARLRVGCRWSCFVDSVGSFPNVSRSRGPWSYARACSRPAAGSSRVPRSASRIDDRRRHRRFRRSCHGDRPANSPGGTSDRP